MNERPTLYHVMIEPRIGGPWDAYIFSAVVPAESLTDAAEWFATWLAVHDVFLNDGDYGVGGDHIGYGDTVGVVSEVSVTTPYARSMTWDEFWSRPTAERGRMKQDGRLK